MAINVRLNHGDMLQFPSHSLKKIVKMDKSWITFCSLKDSKKQFVYSRDFVLKCCYLVPPDVDIQYFLNTTHDRKTAIEAKAECVDAYSNQNVLAGYTIEDESIDSDINSDINTESLLV